jgi:hypothetical protein
MVSYLFTDECAKRAFRSQHAAKDANKRNSKRLRVYRCPGCHLWHVTTTPQKDGFVSDLRRRLAA